MLAVDAPGLFAELFAPGGLQVESVRVCQVEPDAAGGVVLGYEVDWRGPGGAGRDVLYLQPVPDGPTDGLVVQDPDSGRRIRVWRYPDDPALPALAAAVHADAVAVLLARLGLAQEEEEPGLDLVSYRPGRRAVVRAVAGGRTTYLKVVRPRRAALVHEKHRVLADAGLPVPAPLGWSPTGLLVLPAAPGVPALDLLAPLADDDGFARALADLQGLLARGVDVGWAPRRTATTAVDWYADQLGQVAPVLASRARAVATAVKATVVGTPRSTGIHGDLHLGQLLVDPGDGRLTGLLDVDTAGPGDPDEDAVATFAHLEVLALADEDCAVPATAAVERWSAVLLRDPARAGARRAAHLLAYALDPASTGDLDRAQALVGRAEDAVGDRRG